MYNQQSQHSVMALVEHVQIRVFVKLHHRIERTLNMQLLNIISKSQKTMDACDTPHAYSASLGSNAGAPSHPSEPRIYELQFNSKFRRNGMMFRSRIRNSNGYSVAGKREIGLLTVKRPSHLERMREEDGCRRRPGGGATTR